VAADGSRRYLRCEENAPTAIGGGYNLVDSWLELLRDDSGVHGELLDQLLPETDELLATFASMVGKLKKSGI